MHILAVALVGLAAGRRPRVQARTDALSGLIQQDGQLVTTACQVLGIAAAARACLGRHSTATVTTQEKKKSPHSASHETRAQRTGGAAAAIVARRKRKRPWSVVARNTQHTAQGRAGWGAPPLRCVRKKRRTARAEDDRGRCKFSTSVGTLDSDRSLVRARPNPTANFNKADKFLNGESCALKKTLIVGGFPGDSG